MIGDLTTVDLLLSTQEFSDEVVDSLDLNALDHDLYSPLGLALREDKQRIAHKMLD